jgi:hypothetical protein
LLFFFFISAPFRGPVGPADRCPNHLEKIAKLLDLGAFDIDVLQKFTDRQYPSRDRWKQEMNLIWKNGTTYRHRMG